MQSGRWQGTLCKSLLVALLLGLPTPAWASVTLTLASAAGGATIIGVAPVYSSGYGNVNGLGVGTPGAGISVVTAGVSGGALYTTPYNIVLSGLNGAHRATVAGYVSANFVHSSILILETCYPASGCGSGGSFTTLSTNPLAPTTVIGTDQPNGTYTASLGLFVANTDGAGAFTGPDQAILTLTATDTINGETRTVTLALATPLENVQTAVELLVSTAPGGLSITPAADFAANFGNTNGMGVGVPSPGLSILADSGGVLYTTPYLIQPSFSSFASTTCSVTVYVNADFVHPSTLALRDAATSAGPYSNISKLAVSPTPLTTTAASGSSITRYLGLFVSSANGAGAFPGTAGASGADSATLTYTLTVP